MNRVYLNKDVLTASKERISFIFDNFEKIVVSFSGGKDSGVLLNLVIDEARKRNRVVGVVFIDLEAFYQKTIEFIENIIAENIDVLDPYWICLPMESPNSLSYIEPTWVWWEKSKKDIWVREMPTNKYVINEENNIFDFYKKNMSFEQFVKHFANWYGDGKPVASLIGIRTTESLNRYRAIAKETDMFKEQQYSVRLINETYNFYPIYDWVVEDIWIYNGKFKKMYNTLYDVFYKAGVSIHKMRVDEPFGNEAKAGLNLFRVLEPKTWSKVVNRVSGANFGNIYSGNKIMSSKYKLPKNHTWKTFTKFLISTLPEETANNYKTKFIKFINYWRKTGCPMLPEHINILEKNHKDSIINTHEYSARGSKDKEVIKFKKIVDEIPGVDNKDDVLSWKRMAMCIIKNDYLCKGLSFSTTKELTIKHKAIIEKYKNL